MTISVSVGFSWELLPTIYHSSSINGCAVRAVRMSIGSIPIAVIYGEIVYLVMTTDCKSVPSGFDGSSPSLSTIT